MPVQKFLKEVLTPDMKIVLEIGVGRGEFLEALASVLDDSVKIYGIDQSDAYVNETKKTFPQDNVILKHMSAENMTFDDNTFDMICISNTLHHLENEKQVFNEIKRVLKEDGKLIIQEMIQDHQSPAQMSHVWIHHFAAELERYFNRYHDETFRLNAIKNFIEENGFYIEEDMSYNLPEFSHEESRKIIENSVVSLKKLIEKIDDETDQEGFRKRLEDALSGLYENGFALATEYLSINRLAV